MFWNLYIYIYYTCILYVGPQFFLGTFFVYVFEMYLNFKMLKITNVPNVLHSIKHVFHVYFEVRTCKVQFAYSWN